MTRTKRRDTTTISTSFEHYVKADTSSLKNAQMGGEQEPQIPAADANSSEATHGLRVIQRVSRTRTKSRHGHRSSRHHENQTYTYPPEQGPNPNPDPDPKLPTFPPPSSSKKADSKDIYDAFDALTMVQPTYKDMAPVIVTVGGHTSNTTQPPLSGSFMLPQDYHDDPDIQNSVGTEQPLSSSPSGTRSRIGSIKTTYPRSGPTESLFSVQSSGRDRPHTIASSSIAPSSIIEPASTVGLLLKKAPLSSIQGETIKTRVEAENAVLEQLRHFEETTYILNIVENRVAEIDRKMRKETDEGQLLQWFRLKQDLIVLHNQVIQHDSR
ncbi:uncharacterized protein I206_107500 [Kwoniella pini CBS 10737]|uniref:Uncharacterized protein n=1 Tax=Kwoniella pini CBS 10737 TaxID=1296096 RepID=A0A1B9HXG7_9TREE|nr:uncharacterized protein I206_05828 [Kwoniella pini CBS 10737]OCF47962.1 hypothetical protein I206_05828 [Kwoniella pini CBS 10737]